MASMLILYCLSKTTISYHDVGQTSVDVLAHTELLQRLRLELAPHDALLSAVFVRQLDGHVFELTEQVGCRRKVRNRCLT